MAKNGKYLLAVWTECSTKSISLNTIQLLEIKSTYMCYKLIDDYTTIYYI